MRNTYRTIAFILMLLMLVPLLFACGPTDPVQGSDTGSVTTPITEKVPNIYTPVDGVSYNGEDFTILLAPTQLADPITAKSDFDIGGTTEKTVLQQAAFNRIAKVEELYDCDISTIENATYKADSRGAGYTALSNSYQSGMRDYDLVVLAQYDVVPAAVNNLIYNLYDVPNIDVTSEWWDQMAIRDLTYKDALFFSTGDISFYDDALQNTIFFNKNIYAQNITDVNVYDLVKDGTWTLDKLAEMSQYNYRDVDGDQRYTMSDSYGIMTWDDSVYAIANSTGQKVVTYNTGSDKLELTLIGNEPILSAMEKFVDFTTGGNKYGINRSRDTTESSPKMFTDGRALFQLDVLKTADLYVDMETPFGILPYPKATADVDNYYTVLSPFHAAYYCVMNLEEGIEQTGAVVEALAYYGQEQLTPAYYEKVLEGRTIRDNESLISLEIMAANRSYDWGYFIQPDNINKELIYRYRIPSADFSSVFASKESAAKAAVELVNEQFSMLKEFSE